MWFFFRPKETVFFLLQKTTELSRNASASTLVCEAVCVQGRERSLRLLSALIGMRWCKSGTNGRSLKQNNFPTVRWCATKTQTPVMCVAECGYYSLIALLLHLTLAAKDVYRLDFITDTGTDIDPYPYRYLSVLLSILLRLIWLLKKCYKTLKD